MKILFFLFLIFPALAAPRSRQSPYPLCKPLGCDYKLCPGPDGDMTKAAIFFDTKRVENADPATFKALPDGYAADSNFVYFEGTVIENADPSSISTYGYNYAADDKNLYYAGKIVEGFDLNTLALLPYYYVLDYGAAYYKGKKIEGADYYYLEPIDSDGGYAADRTHIFYEGELLEGADAETFEVLNAMAAKDKNHVYHRGKVIGNIDAATVRAFEDGYDYLIDKDRVYYIFEPIETIDRESFTYLGGGYIKDKRNVYHDGSIIDGADPETFEYDPEKYADARDKNSYYRCGKKRQNDWQID